MCSGTPAHCQGPPATPRRALHHAEMILKLSCFPCMFLMYGKGFTDMYPMCCLDYKNWVYVHAMCTKELEMSYVWWEVKNCVSTHGYNLPLASRAMTWAMVSTSWVFLKDIIPFMARTLISPDPYSPKIYKRKHICISFMVKGIRWEKKKTTKVCFKVWMTVWYCFLIIFILYLFWYKWLQ